MELPWYVFPIGYLVCGLAPLALVPTVVRHVEKPGSTGLLATLYGLATWAVGLAILVTGGATDASYAVVLSAATVAMFGSQLTAVGYLFLAGEYTGRLAVTRRRLVAAAAIVAVVQLLYLTDPLHHLAFGGVADPLLDHDALAPVGLVSILLSLSLAISVGAVGLLLVEGATATGVRRRQSVVIALAGAATIVAFLADQVVITGLDQSVFPVAFAVTGFAYGWAVVRADFLDVVPVAHRRIVEVMDDAAVVVDGDDRVVECNPAARRLVGAGPDYAGQPLREFFGMASDVVDRFADVYGVDTEIRVTTEGGTRHFLLNISRLETDGSTDADPGRLIVLRDVTPLKEREAELEFLKRLQARVLRHNLRNDLTVIRGHAEHLAERGDEVDEVIARKIAETTDGLLALSRKARTIERVIERREATGSIDLAAVVRDLAEGLSAAVPNASVSVTAPERCVVETDPRLETALEILLENAVDHHDGDRPTIEVRLDRTDDVVVVTVADDGPGIPPDELTVLERGEETPLDHSSGIGLWIVHWVVERAGATIDFDTGERGTRVSIQIPA